MFIVFLQSNVNVPLKVEVYHATVADHQENAILCLSLLKDMAEKAAAFRRIISLALVDSSFQGGGLSVLDKFFLSDNSLWICKCTFSHALSQFVGEYNFLLTLLRTHIMYVFTGGHIVHTIRTHSATFFYTLTLLMLLKLVSSLQAYSLRYLCSYVSSENT